MCAAVGLPTEVDVALMNAVRAQTPQSQPPEEQYAVTCLLFVFIALSLPRLALSPTSTFKATLHGWFLYPYDSISSCLYESLDADMVVVVMGETTCCI